MSGPLSGYRVVDFSTALAAPWAAGILSDQGADVIKVERMEGDLARVAGIHVGDISAMFHMANRGKRSIALDMKHEEGRKIAQQLASSADVVVHNFRPDIASRLGVDYEQLRLLRQDIIVVSVTGFGSVGPESDRPAFDSVIQAESGMCVVQKSVDGEPTYTTHAVVDKIVAMTAAQGAVAALLARERGAGGQFVEVPMLDVAIEFLWMDRAGEQTLLDAPQSNSSGVTDGLRMFLPCEDGWIALSLGRGGSVEQACRAFDINPELHLAEGQIDPSRRADLVAFLKTSTKQFTVSEASERLATTGMVYGIVRELEDLHATPQAAATGLFQEGIHPTAGRLRQPRPSVRFGEGPMTVSFVSPSIGGNTSEILTELGREDEAELRAEGIVA